MPIDEVYQGLPQQVTVTEPPPAPSPSPALRPQFVPDLAEAVEYPSEDGNPMAAGLSQAYAMMDFHFMLREEHYVERTDVFVAIDLLVYYREGDRNSSVAPDVFVALGVSSEIRQLYKVWEEGKVPDFVIEFASLHTADYDAAGKRDLYESLGVREYWLYDPQGGFHAPRLQGFVLEEGRYEPIEPEQRVGVQRALCSEVLGVELHFDGERLRVWDPVRKQYLLTPKEAKQGRQEAERVAREAERARQEAERARQEAEQVARGAQRQAQAAAAKVAELEAALQSLRGER